MVFDVILDKFFNDKFCLLICEILKYINSFRCVVWLRMGFCDGVLISMYFLILLLIYIGGLCVWMLLDFFGNGFYFNFVFMRV